MLIFQGPLVRVTTAAFLFLFIFSWQVCSGHGGGHAFIDPPPPPVPPPPPPWTHQPPNPGTIPGSNPGGPSTPSPQTGGKGATTGGKVSGAMTKKSRAASPQITWERWWARNRYQYLDFPSLMDNARMYPVSPRPRNGADIIEPLKEKSLTMMRPMLDSESARLKRAALVALARLDDQESYPKVLELLRDPNYMVRDDALCALCILNHPSAKLTLMHIARGTKSAVRTIEQKTIPAHFRGFAQLSLAMDQKRGFSAVLRSLAEDPACPADVKAIALESLGLYHEEDSTRYLMDFVENSKKAPKEVLASAVTALARSRDPVVLPFLEKSLFSDCLPVRQSAALGLGRLARPDDEDIVKKLIRCHKQTHDQALKGFSLIAMGQIGGPGAMRYLDSLVVRGKSSESPWACLGLGLALRQGGGDVFKKHLVDKAARKANRSIQGAAAIALGIAKCKEGVDALINGMEKGDDVLFRGYCAMALGMIGDPRCNGPLHNALKEDGKPQLKSQAALALALMNDVTSAPELVDLLLSSKNEYTKFIIALGLGFIGDVQIVKTILDRLEKDDLDDQTTYHCVRLISRLLSGQTVPYLDPLAAGSNYASQYPLVEYLLDIGI